MSLFFSIFEQAINALERSGSEEVSALSNRTRASREARLMVETRTSE